MSRIKKEIIRFLVAGSLAFGTDFMVYYFLLNFMSHSPAKTCSFITASVLAYLLGKYWTFNFRRKSFFPVVKFTMLNTTTLGANVAVNKVSLLFFPGFVLFAFILVSGTSTVLNFIGQKWWVFRDNL